MRHSVRCVIPTSSGLQLSGIREMPEGDPIGSILFSHCFTCNKDLKAIVKISRALAELGWSVLRYDFRGLGHSEGRFRESSFTTNLEDMRAACDFLESVTAQPDLLIGHSFGGAASLYQAEQVDSARGVVALAAPSDTHHLASLLEKMDPAIATVGQGEVVIGGFRYQVDRSMPEDFRRYDLPSAVAQIRKPLLALHSRTDETVAYQHALRNCGFQGEKAHAGPRSLVTLPDCDHLLSSEAICKAVARCVDAWGRSLLVDR
ncbi:alpha/beta hydrolase family protein [Pirellulaceae bacterium SH449]